MIPESAIPLIYAFLDRIGIGYAETALDPKTFLPGLLIENGSLKIDRRHLLYPGDILHEAGHIALTDPAVRPQLNQAMLAARPPAESDEVGVQLWSYLAAREIGLPPEIVFHDGGYHGQAGWLMGLFDQGNYIGLPLLAAWDMAEANANGGLPRIISWLRITTSPEYELA